MKGVIALDIDGTVTLPGKPIPQEVVDFLHQLSREHWQILFVTGRTFQWGYEVLKVLTFPYYLAVQNGAITLEMPTRKILLKKYLDKGIIPSMQKICEEEPTDFVIYAGYEYEDLCYYRPSHFDNPLHQYLKERATKMKEVWRQLTTFDELDLTQFPSIKCFGINSAAEKVARRIQQSLGLHVPVIRDPVDENYFVAQATHAQANKGQVLSDLSDLLSCESRIIAAGDDYNDLSMLSKANIKVVMQTAPLDIKQMADIIAPSAADKGIIQGLKNALKLHNIR
jgi:Cof subfamily protein (haloacid dehalogenase superfamily)